jgi:hypothetical protein
VRKFKKQKQISSTETNPLEQKTMQVEISKPHNKPKEPAPEVQKHSQPAPRTANPKSVGSFTSKSVHNSYNKQSRDIGFFFWGVMVGELGRPIVGPPRSADRLKKLAHNSNSNNRKNPKPTTTKIR